MILLTHPPQVRENYYSDKALVALKSLGEVRLCSLERELSTSELIDAARGCEIIPATAEWVLGAMIDLGRRISISTADYHAGKVPASVMGRQLKGATLGVIGYGQIGRYLCDLGIALGMRVLVSDPYAKVANAALAQVELSQLLAASDFVACLALATEETENLMNARAFAQMKPGAFFVNASRGNLVDEAALLRVLDDGRIAGCAMDVGRAGDQMPSPALARHPQVIATPHIGGLTPQATGHQALETVAQVGEILKGRVPNGAVNAQRATRLTRLRVTDQRSAK